MFKNPEKIFFNSQQIDNSSSFSIIHFNDVYDIEISQGEAADGGAARFVGLIEDLLSQGPTIVVFSGDALSPSLSKLLFFLEYFYFYFFFYCILNLIQI